MSCAAAVVSPDAAEARDSAFRTPPRTRGARWLPQLGRRRPHGPAVPTTVDQRYCTALPGCAALRAAAVYEAPPRPSYP
jgi:hypothetical protein